MLYSLLSIDFIILYAVIIYVKKDFLFQKYFCYGYTPINFYTALLHIMFDLKLEKSSLLKILAYGQVQNNIAGE